MHMQAGTPQYPPSPSTQPHAERRGYRHHAFLGQDRVLGGLLEPAAALLESFRVSC